ncbi:MAG: hypothetical protein IKU52_08535 [Clostridia bacterium]|nr:hypothetical protein [Clostridia bacterium]
MKENGICFQKGLSDSEIDRIENIYDILLPSSLRNFYKYALPIGKNFPKWNDFSNENINFIKERMYLPYKWISSDIMWCKALWEIKDAPKLIPIYSHRYMPIINHPDPPVFSTVGRDTIWYGKNLREYFYNEFIREYNCVTDYIPYVPLWSEIIRNNK